MNKKLLIPLSLVLSILFTSGLSNAMPMMDSYTCHCDHKNHDNGIETYKIDGVSYIKYSRAAAQKMINELEDDLDQVQGVNILLGICAQIPSPATLPLRVLAGGIQVILWERNQFRKILTRIFKKDAFYNRHIFRVTYDYARIIDMGSPFICFN